MPQHYEIVLLQDPKRIEKWTTHNEQWDRSGGKNLRDGAEVRFLV